MVRITIPYVQLHYLCHFQVILETDPVQGGKREKQNNPPYCSACSPDTKLIMVDFVLK